MTRTFGAANGIRPALQRSDAERPGYEITCLSTYVRHIPNFLEIIEYSSEIIFKFH